MNLRYEKLGKFIEEVKLKNENLAESKLLSVGANKKFISPPKNVKKSDFKDYKIVEYNQFAYNPVTSRNGDKISIALLKERRVIVSPSHKVFSIKDTSILSPDYLMLWFKRPEFDRYARFHSHGFGKEVFSWDDLCKTKIPIPSINKQNRIVSIVKFLDDRIRLKEKINHLLEELIQIIFKNFFIDFKYFKIDYSKKTEMGYLPYGWKTDLIGQKIRCVQGNTPSRDANSYCAGDIAWINSGKINELRILHESESISKEVAEKYWLKLLPKKSTVIATSISVLGHYSLLELSSCINQSVIGLVPNDEFPYEFIYSFVRENISNMFRDEYFGIKKHINKKNVEDAFIICPPHDVVSFYKNIVSPIFDMISLNCLEIEKIEQFKISLVSRLIFNYNQ